MAEQVTVARPYAEAVFRIAREGNSFALWSDQLAFMGALLANRELADVIGNPRLTRADVETLMLSLVQGKVDDQGANLIRAMGENRRLSLMPLVASEFERLRREHEQTADAEIASAFPLSDAQVKDLVISVEGKLKRKVTPRVRVDATLIGGVKITVGDQVFDASVRARLDAMRASLKN